MINRRQYEEALYNCLLFIPGKGEEKSQASLGWGRVVVEEDCLSIQGADNYVWINCHVQGEGMAVGPTRYVYRDTLKEELTRVKDLTEDEVDFDLTLVEEEPAPSVGELYRGYDTLWTEGNQQFDTYSFAVNPNRVAKFSLLKPQDEYPADFLWSTYSIEDDARDFLAWRMGPRSRGILGILDRDTICKVIKEKDALW